MAVLEPQPSSTPSEPERRRADAQDMEQLFKDIVARYEELKQRNRDLEETNGRLMASLKEATERVVHIEQSLSTFSQLSRFATAMAAQMLGRAAESVEAMSKASQSESASTRQEARRRALGLQMEALLLLEGARDEALQRIQETDQKAIEILKKTRESILALAQDLERAVPQAPPPMTETSGVRPSATLPDDGVAPTAAGQTPSAPVSYLETPAPANSAPADPIASTSVDGIELIASPFQSVSALSVFLRAVKQSPGVADVKAQGFDRGILRLGIRYVRPMAPETVLSGLSQFYPRLVSADAERVEIVISDGGVEGADPREHGR